MAYVDLNPIRAGMADIPEDSDFTSLQQRIGESEVATPNQTEASTQSLEQTIPKLLGFSESIDSDDALPFGYDDYLELVDWSGRAIHPTKSGKVPDDIPPILQRLRINPGKLIRYLNRQERGFYLLIGRPDSLQQAVANFSRRFLKGISAANRLFAAQGS